MPLNEKGKKIEREMVNQYGPKKGKEVFHKAIAKGTIKGVEKAPRKKRHK